MTTSFRKCHILKPEDSSPNRDSNRTIALVVGEESRRANRYTTRRGSGNKGNFGVVRTRVKYVLIHSKREDAILYSLAWTQAANFISKGTMFCSYVSTTA